MVACLAACSRENPAWLILHEGQKFDAEIVGKDKKTDLALLKIKPGDTETSTHENETVFADKFETVAPAPMSVTIVIEVSGAPKSRSVR